MPSREESSSFWRKELQGAQRATFPPLRNKAGKSSNQQHLKRSTIICPSEQGSHSQEVLLKAAWALVLARHGEDVDDICYGSIVLDSEELPAALTNRVTRKHTPIPVRVSIDRSQSVQTFLQKVELQDRTRLRHAQLGLSKISGLSEGARAACQFPSLLVVKSQSNAPASIPTPPYSSPSGSDEEDTDLAVAAAEQYHSLTLKATLKTGKIDFVWEFDPSVLDEYIIEALSHHLEHALQQLRTLKDEPLSSLSIAGPWDRQEARRLNIETPTTMSRCIHDLIFEHAKTHPDSPAVCGWDGEFTYSELDAASDRLARHLSSAYHVQDQDYVHVCFEKSVWFIVAILAINRAGAAYVPLEPAHPVQRKKQIIEKTRAKLVLTSAGVADHCQGLANFVIEVTEDLDAELRAYDAADSHSIVRNQVSSSNAAYVLFTSGSTGVPKGFVIEHSALSSSVTALNKRISVTRDVRMLAFASYTFDMSVGEIFCTLRAGGSIFVPSEHDRLNNIANFINKHDINWLFLTPAYARTLRPDEVPGVKLVWLAGEAISQEVFVSWASTVRLVNGWGPAETCICNTIQEWTSTQGSRSSIGKNVGSYCWIVEPDDPTRLAPIGTVGEVVIQGPTLLREYLNDSERTNASMVYGVPEWAPDKSTWSRFYKSGDLCFYRSDGTMQFVSRKDTQVKIRGLRVELEEVEHNVRHALSGVQQVAVDVSRREGGIQLVAYLCFSNSQRGPDCDPEQIFLPIDDAMRHDLRTLAGRLQHTLPNYMVPTLFIPCRFMPAIASTKLDRIKLRAATASLDSEDLLMYSLLEASEEEPVTETEMVLQRLWADVLAVKPSSIGRESNFLGLGGDSIAAIKLVTEAGRKGLELTFKLVFQHPTLSSMASIASSHYGTEELDKPTPFSLLSAPVRAMLSVEQLASQCNLSSSNTVVDAYPSTKLQEGLMALTVKQPGSYINRYVYTLPRNIDIGRFQEAWEKTIQSCENLRTRFVLLEGMCVQVVVDETVEWEDTDGKVSIPCAEGTRPVTMSYGSRLCRQAITYNKDGSFCFLWTVHHAIFDGFSLRLIIDTLTSLYQDLTPPELQPFSRFISHIGSLDSTAAQKYWSEQLRGARRAPFPAISDKTSVKDTHQTAHLSRDLQLPRNKNSSITTATILRAAWSLLLACYCDTDDVCFGTTVSGRQAPVRGIEMMPGAAVATVPLRVQLKREQTISKFLESVQDQALQMIEFEQYGLQNIAKLGPEAKAACDFSSLMIVQPMNQVSEYENNKDALLMRNSSSDEAPIESMEGYFNYPLVVQLQVFDDHVNTSMMFHEDVLNRFQVEAMAHQLAHIAGSLSSALASDTSALLSSLVLAGPWDLQQAISWNAGNGAIVDECLHGVICRHAKTSPAREAIYSYEGSMSYQDLDKYSDRLASHLHAEGLVPEARVPVLFDKSMWALVAMLGIMKAGGVFVPLDPTHPPHRRQTLIRQVEARLLLASPNHAEGCRSMVDQVIEVSPAFLHELPDGPLPQISTTNAAYILFTSGSTGNPKGIIVEHSAICTSMQAHGNFFGLDDSSRVLQFSSYVFDALIVEVFTTLFHGGTVCVPSEDQRFQDLNAFITEARVNTAMPTPSFAKTFTPAQTPTMRRIVFGGEAPTQEVVDIWFGSVKLINGYGPSETCVYCTAYEYKSASEPILNIGRGLHGNYWLVDPDDHDRLAPIGTVGELVIHSHALARGYYGDDDRTEQSFLEKVAWLPSDLADPRYRFYKTGDLVRYNTDGTLTYVARKDTQVKLRGQRLELGEIEHTLMVSDEGLEYSVADVVKTESGDALVAFISFKDKGHFDRTADGSIAESTLQVTAPLRQTLIQLKEQLRMSLPSFMVPSFYVPLSSMPFNISMKLDRKRLKGFVSELNANELLRFSLGDQDKTEPCTSEQLQLRSLWAKVLGIQENIIGKNDSFLDVGGDSITAIYLSSLAKKNGIDLSVAQIFGHPRLFEMSEVMSLVKACEVDHVKPFSMLTGDVDVLEQAVRAECRLGASQVLNDILPCTPLQEGLIALTVKQPGLYTAKYTYKLSPEIDVHHFKSAWEETVRKCDNLRTRIVRNGETTLQAVIEKDYNWINTTTDSFHTLMTEAQEVCMGYGQPLARYALIEQVDGQKFFVLVIHHSVVDGWSLQIMLDILHKAYLGHDIRHPFPYSSFISHVQQMDVEAAAQFWTAQLEGAARAAFPPPRPLGQFDGKSDTHHLNRVISLEDRLDGVITKATLLRTAWALLLAQYSNTKDITFGLTVSGRQAPVPDIDETTGPTVATVPFRMQLEPNVGVSDFLKKSQDDALDMIPYEQYGIQRISKLSAPIKEAVDFTSLLVIQPAQQLKALHGAEAMLSPVEPKDYSLTESLQGYFNYPLVAQCQLLDDGVDLVLSYDSSVLSDKDMNAFAHQFDHNVHQLQTQGGCELTTMSMAGPWDLQQAAGFNKSPPFRLNACWHDIFKRQASMNPDAEAVYTETRSMTYQELDHISTRLASRLMSQGVTRGNLIPFCFEKSTWTIVAIIAILKAGAAFVPLDPSHPQERHLAIIRQTKPKLVIASAALHEQCASYVKTVIPVSARDLEELLNDNTEVFLPKCEPTDQAYVLFTSGSTGEPKGIIVEHKAFVSSILSPKKVFSPQAGSRVLQFSSYAFDASLEEILIPLLHGATVCVPTEESRMDVAAFINQARVNHAVLTPSFVSTMTPAQVPTLKTLMIIGEPASRAVIRTWQPAVNLVNGYGPTETCLYCAAYLYESVEDSPTTIGFPVHSNCWVVDAEDDQKLVPIGCIGELVVQGQALARGYLGDEHKTGDVFLPFDHFQWVPADLQDDRYRFYKTGDLVKYDTDGKLQYLGRKDTQAKLRGQRLEIGEIEYAVAECLPQAAEVAVEIATRESGQALVAFIVLDHNVSWTDGIEDGGDMSTWTAEGKDALHVLKSHLRVRLPAFMIPSYYVPLKKMKRVSAMKVDRKALKALFERLSNDRISGLSPGQRTEVEPNTVFEMKIRDMWATILKIPPETIKKDDAFLDLGGDSISAIHLASTAREESISISVADIFRDSRLCNLAAIAESRQTESQALQQPMKPFSLLPLGVTSEDVTHKCNLSAEETVQDAYPCTALQQGLMALTVKQPGSYIAKYDYRLASEVDVQRFKTAWERTVELCGSLRTRIVSMDKYSKYIQAVVSERASWDAVFETRSDSYHEPATAVKMGFGTRLCRYSLVQTKDERLHFILTIHHACYDGWSIRLVFNIFEQLYLKSTAEAVQITPYLGFITYLESLDETKSREFWKRQLSGTLRATFPPRKSASSLQSDTLGTQTFEKVIAMPRNHHKGITHASIVRAAWALVLAKHNDTEDICFGATVSGRNAPVYGVENMAGPMFATVPVRVLLDKEQSPAAFLKHVQSQAAEMVPHEQYGLQRISKLSESAREACDFSSLLVVQPTQHENSSQSTSFLEASGKVGSFTEDALQGYFNYPLVVLCDLRITQLNLVLFYKTDLVDEALVTSVAHHFEHCIHQLLEEDLSQLKDVSLVGKWDLDHAIASHRIEPAVMACTHWLIEKQVNQRPTAIAVSSWDGQLTYRELGLYGTRLCNRLKHAGVGPESMVPICFNKSRWAVVSMLAVQMAGGAFVPIDPTAPTTRIQEILTDVQAKIALVSPETQVEVLVNTPGLSLITVQESSLESTTCAAALELSNVDPQNASFVIFTSGSTGKPKGMVHSHAATCSTVNAYGKGTGIGPDTRVFNFSAFTFDVGILDVLATLIRGGCVCLPSEHGRFNNLTEAINNSRADWMFLTPSVVDLLQPGTLPHIKTLALGGEAISDKTVQAWKKYAKLINIYGPAETSICAYNLDFAQSAVPNNIGRPANGEFWVVEPEDIRKLVPVGCVGELIVQGPLLARGYINADGNAGANFIEDASWFPGAFSRAYRSGDLVRRNTDGTFSYVGRKDDQVKIHGQRVELGEIENRIQTILPGDIAAKVLLSRGEKGSSKSLVAFLWYNHGSRYSANKATLWDPIEQDQRQLTSHVHDCLSKDLPSYMLPSFYMILKGTPEKTTSGKVSARFLEDLGDSVSITERRKFSPESVPQEPPTTSTELKLCQLWTEVLPVEASAVRRKDSFFRLGGDSISAIQLVQLAPKYGIALDVGTIFSKPCLDEMSLHIETTRDTANVCKLDEWSRDCKSFELLPTTDQETLLSEAAEQCAFSDKAVIQDMYPTTTMQEGLMTLAVKQPGSYIGRHVFRLARHIDPVQFRTAWEITVRHCANLRTRIVQLNGASYQLVIDHGVEWDSISNLNDYLQEIQDLKMGYGTPLSRSGFYESTEAGNCCFVWSAHHSVFDGFALQSIMETLRCAYRHKKLPDLYPFSRFVKYTTGLDVTLAQDFWNSQLEGAIKATFPPNTRNLAVKRQSRIHSHKIPMQAVADTSITRATVLRTAWAVVLARYTETDDICFGATVSGRQAPVANVQSLAGPTVTTVPVRVALDSGATILNLLHSVQLQAAHMVPFEQFGIQNIAKLSANARELCDFSSLMVIQPAREFIDWDDSESMMTQFVPEGAEAEEILGGFFTYPLILQVSVYEGHVGIDFVYDANLLSALQMEALSYQLDHVVQELTTKMHHCLSDINVAGPWDLKQVCRWNDFELVAGDRCVHDMIKAQAIERPDHEAVWSTDGVWTYAQLDRLSDQLAWYLHSIGVTTETVIPFCFEKSRWTTLAILGTMKAGGVFMPLDPTHPLARREALVKEVGAKYMFVSPEQLASSQSLAEHVIPLSAEFMDEVAAKADPVTIKVKPSNACYVLFTSGSTGKPKGVVVEHHAKCSSIHGQTNAFGLTHASRVLQWSNYVFDVSVTEHITTLSQGATICVPNEVERLHETADFISRARVNTTMLTPSFARTLMPDQVPGIHTLILGGEAPTKDLLETWQGKVKFINGYGPAETVIYSSCHEFSSKEEHIAVIGAGCNSKLWLVDAEDHNRLTPVGCVGEILVQGPSLARGYYNNPEKFKAVLLEQVDWMPVEANPHGYKFYKTGDLGHYTKEGGVVEYASRRDAQVKLRGMRIELGEIEHHIQGGVPEVKQAAVIITKDAGTESLVAFTSMADEDEAKEKQAIEVLPMDKVPHDLNMRLYDHASSKLPPHMVPSYFIPVTELPETSSGKIDRKRLQELVRALSTAQLKTYIATASGEFRKCQGEIELGVRHLWADVLRIQDEEGISADDNFYHLGGDSIRVVTLTNKIFKKYDVTLGFNIVNSRNTTIAMIAKLVEKAKAEEFVDLAADDEISLMKEVQQVTEASWASSATGKLPHPLSSLPSEATVFLTGATGYLGNELLRQLVNMAAISKVCVHVRASSMDEGMKRIMRTARITGWWCDAHADKIEVWLGDLNKPRIGLNGEQWDRLAGMSSGPGNVHAFVHNGAVVNWHADYDKLKAANVYSAVGLLKLSLTSPLRPKYVFVSGGVIADTTVPLATTAKELRLAPGYSQSKWVAETAILEVVSRFGKDQNRVSVIKPGRIIGNPDEGVANVDDFLWRMVATAAALGTFPVEPESHWMSVGHVGGVADAVLHQIIAREAISPYTDVEIGLPVFMFWDLVKSQLPTRCEPISWNAWQAQARQQMDRVGDTYPLWPVQHFIGAEMGSPCAADPPPVVSDAVKEAIKSNVNYLRRIGFVREDGKFGLDLPADVMGRSGVFKG